MANLVQTSVYAINRTVFSPPVSKSFSKDQITGINPVRDANGNWIGKNQLPMPTRQYVYSEIEVANNATQSFNDHVYTDRTVSQMTTAVNA